MAFLTVFPMPFRDGAPTQRELAASRYAYPFVGLAIGLFAACLSEVLAQWNVPQSVSATILIAVAVVITGGLHLDGLADTCDGLFMPRGDAQRRLDAMRDPHLGSFGVIAIAMALIAKYSALVTLEGHLRSRAIVGALAISRTLVLVAAGLSRSARTDGTGRFFIEATSPRDALGAALLAGGIGVATLGQTGLLASLSALVLACLLTHVAILKLRGTTGDILGAVIEVSEVAVLASAGLLVGV